MISKEEAQQLALKEVQQSGHEFCQSTSDEVVIIDSKTIEKDFGWVFFYQSKCYLKTLNFSDMLIGNAPIIVNKFDGSLHYTGTAYEAEHYIREYERKLK